MVATEKRVKMSHGETRYFEAGTGYPTILIHGAGFTSGGDSWLYNMIPMSEKYRCLAIDCLNFGTGDPFNDEFSFAYLVDHVREFMDVLEVEKANVVGRSMGGWIATLIAYESPERVNKLVIQAPGGAATRPLQVWSTSGFPRMTGSERASRSGWRTSTSTPSLSSSSISTRRTTRCRWSPSRKS